MGNDYALETQREWRNSRYICAFSDSERHLGHLVKTDQWHAYDATHLNGPSGGFSYLGRFTDLAVAKQAVELAVASSGKPRTMRVGVH